MNNSEIFLLGLINQSPRYGYEIAQFLEESNASLWINLSMPYVYRLLKQFEKEGLVSSKQVESFNRPNKNVYEITSKGQKVLMDSIINNRFGADKIYFGMDVALALFTLTDRNFNLLPIVEEQIERIRHELGRFDMEGIKNAELSDDAVTAILIIKHHIGFLESEVEWLEKVRETLVKNGL